MTKAAYFLPIVFTCLFATAAHAVKLDKCRVEDSCIERYKYDPNPAVACAEATAQADGAVKSFCRSHGGVFASIPKECIPEDVSYAWGGKPMFKQTRQVTHVQCNGNRK
ncbi:MAG: hypothetical protein NTW45_04285 [Rhodocyclales bacterium]|nr:hypothetical protein [Rhodocyclales bacterium]